MSVSAVDTALRRSRIILTAALTVLLVAGCGGGDDGDPGPQGPKGDPGPQGPPGPPAAEATTDLDMTITDVTIASPPVVEFSVSDQDGAPYTGLTTDDLRFTIAKLIPGTNGDPSRWQSYVNTTEEAVVGPGTGTTAVQATRENDGELVDHGDGTYTYTYATDVTNVTEPLRVPYSANQTHRVAIQTRGGLPAENAVYTFRPADGATQGIPARDIVATESCNECHNKLEAHDERIEVEYCVTCHNPGSRDANSRNTVDFKVLIHKLHRGASLPSVEAGGEYAIWGFRDSKHNYSNLHFPQDIRNCTKCHTGADEATPDGDNWQTNLSIAACGSCHDDVNFAQGIDGGHPGGAVTENGECVTCHAAGRVAGSVAESHAIPEAQAAEKFKYEILSVTNTAPGQMPRIRFRITDPTNNNAPYDLTSDPEFTTGGGVARLAVIIGWDNTDHNNADNGTDGPGSPISIDALSEAEALGNGVFRVTSPTAIPAGVTGSGVVGIEGHPAAPDENGDFTIRAPVTSVVEYFAITDDEPTARRHVVDGAKCNNCHERLSLHGNNRNNEPQVCVICHNPNATDINRRPDDPSETADGKREESIDFKRLIHGIHAAAMREDDPLVVYGFGNREHVFDEMQVHFPGILQDCDTCHREDTYMLSGVWSLPTDSGILSSTVHSGLDQADPADDENISPTAAVCSSCHTGAAARSHMESNGAVFDQTQGVIDSTVESCSVCHGPGVIADVAEVHATE